ncbi:MAG: eukaryotic-like serine/threonine-protein kinase, partial [Actinomycetota bacterium]|nr:eukaryotic-like serine/threonine-protein kinase [Actinomycetota bacterium]
FRRGRPLSAAPVNALISDTSATVANPRVGAAGGTTQIGTLAPARTRGRRAIVTIATVLVLALIIGAVVAVAQVAGQNSDKVSVPKVTGDDFATALTKLQQAGFSVTEQRVQNATVPENHIVSQDPAAGDLFKKGGTVRVKVSAGVGQVAVPETVGKNANDAKKLLVDTGGFNVTTVPEANDNAPLYTVLRTDPPAGQRVARGSAVKLIVSSGPETASVPNVLNLDVAAAAAQLGSAGFTVRQTAQPSDTAPINTVIRTDPGPNAKAPKGSLINVFVSTGPQQIAVPSVVGLKQAEAEKAISDAGLTPRVITAPSTKGNNGKVILQSPTEGTQVDKNSIVVITVGEVDQTTTTTGGTTTTTGP